MAIDVKIDFSKFTDLTRNQMRRIVLDANRAALNRSLTPLRTLAIRITRDELGLKRKDVLRRLFINRATTQHPSASLKISGRPLPLAFFQPRVKTVRVASVSGKKKSRRKGVTALIDGQRQIIPGGFLAQMRSGHSGVFRRRGDPRLPIAEMTTKQLPNLFEKRSTFRILRADMIERYDREYRNAFSFYLERARSRAAARNSGGQ